MQILEVIVFFLLAIVLLVMPVFLMIRGMLSKETRSHMIALLIHDLIKAIVKGLASLLRRMMKLAGAIMKSLFGR